MAAASAEAYLGKKVSYYSTKLCILKTPLSNPPAAMITIITN
jgi:hypothetical protein